MQEYNSTSIEVPDSLLAIAQETIPCATSYTLADEECRALNLIVHFQEAKEVGRQKI
jgi:hypothetical protein